MLTGPSKWKADSFREGQRRYKAMFWSKRSEKEEAKVERLRGPQVLPGLVQEHLVAGAQLLALSRAALAFIDTTVKIKKVDPVAVATR